jgi:hypothetical protein
MNARKRSFSGQTEETAAILHPAFQVAASSGFKALKLQGAWVDRRFIIETITIAADVPSFPANPLAMTLTVPSTISPESLATSCRSFGGVVERIWREVDRGKFDFVVSADDADWHIVHRYNDAAVCGHRPRRWLSDAEMGSFAGKVQSCPKCIAAATHDDL